MSDLNRIEVEQTYEDEEKVLVGNTCSFTHLHACSRIHEGQYVGSSHIHHEQHNTVQGILTPVQRDSRHSLQLLSRLR